MGGHGWPGQTGHTSFAALSQTVKTKLRFGAPGFANSSQLLLRSPPWAGEPLRVASAPRDEQIPAGWLPALYAMKLGRPLRFRMASAMIERAELPVHRNSTL